MKEHEMKTLMTKEEALQALDNLDDYARMAGVDPIGARGVLQQYIEETSNPEPIPWRASRVIATDSGWSYNRELEAATLGAILRDGRLFYEVPSFISAADFSSKNSDIYTAMASIIADCGQIDVVTVAEKLGGRLDELVGLAERAIGTQVSAYCEGLRAKSIDRALLSYSASVLDIVSDRMHPDEKLERAAAGLSAISCGDNTDVVEIGEIALQAARAVDDRSTGKTKPGLMLGLSAVDDVLGGVQDTDLIVVGARPSMGKSALAIEFAKSICLAGKCVLFFSLEMSRTSVANRLIASIGGIPLGSIRSGHLNDAHWARLSDVVSSLNGRNLLINDRAGINIDYAATVVRRMARQRKIDLVIFDYLQLISGPKSDGRTNEISHVSSTLKNIAKSNNIPVMALSQVNRECESRQNKRPSNYDLKGSGQIEQDADVIMLLYRDEVYNKKSNQLGVAEIHISKNREGETKMVCVKAELHISRFSDMQDNCEVDHGFEY